MKNYYIFLNKDKSVFDITEENKHIKDFIILNYEDTISLLHLIKKTLTTEKVYYINEAFEINKDFDLYLNELRDIRNKKIASTDFYFLNDVIDIYDNELINKIKQVRQQLRDITNNINSIEDIENAIKFVNEF